MRNLFFSILIIFSFELMAKNLKKNTILHVNFEKNGKTHKYLIEQINSKKPEFLMSFVNEKNKTQTKKVSKRQVDLLRGDATRIIWKNQYRKPSSNINCREYAVINTDLEKTRICYENKISVGRTFGFLNSLNRFFQ